jgi:hypothetical protein
VNTIKITLKDLKFLLECEERAQASTKVGYVGADKTAKELIAHLNAKVEVSADAVEAALFSLEQLSEKGYSVNHPEGVSKDALIRRLTPTGYVFDRELGVFYKERR